MIKIKKGNLNYDQSGRAYPDNPELKENWDCIWEHDDKYYELVGDNEHKEWEEVNIYDRIIDEVYKNYLNEWTFEKYPNDGSVYSVEPIKVKEHTKEQFVYRCKTNPEFSEKWGLKIEERELSTQERNEWFQIHLNGNNPFMKSDWKDFELDQQNTPTKLITITYNNEKIENYE